MHMQVLLIDGFWELLKMRLSRLTKKAGNKDSAIDKHPSRLEVCLELYNGQMTKYQELTHYLLRRIYNVIP
jgi:hypothetical protein